jgi:hypothetical protein
MQGLSTLQRKKVQKIIVTSGPQPVASVHKIIFATADTQHSIQNSTPTDATESCSGMEECAQSPNALAGSI